MVPAVLVLDFIPEFDLDNNPSDTIPFSQNNYFRHSLYEQVNSQLERIFSEMFPSERSPWPLMGPPGMS